MTGRRSAGGARRRALRRESDGGLFDLDDLRVVSTEELLDDLRAGRRFRAHRRGTGADCTVEVLAEVLGRSLSEHLPGQEGFARLFFPPDLLSVRHLGQRTAPCRHADHSATPEAADAPTGLGHA